MGHKYRVRLRTLIEIAWNKPRRSMTTAFTKYKAQRQKATEEKKPHAIKRIEEEGLLTVLVPAEYKWKLNTVGCVPP